MNFLKKYWKPITIGAVLGLALGILVVSVTETPKAEATACNLICPEGYSHVSQSHQGYCYKGNSPDWPEDYKAKVCQPTPTPTPTVKPTCTPTPEPTVEPTVTPTPEPSQSPEPSVEPTPVDTTDHTIYPAGAPICNDDGVKFAPTVTRAWRTGTDLDVRWTKTDTNDFVIYYGPTTKNLIWNTGRIQGYVFGDLWDYTVHHVNQMVDVKVCSVSSCGAEKCSVVFIDP